jgi:ABC-type lipoprotein release transport system permease subunit
MKISRQLYFSYQLIRSHFLQYFFAILGIFLGTASVFFFFSLTEGIKKGVQDTLTTQENILTVQMSGDKMKIFQKKINDDTVQNFRKMDGVEKVYPETSLLVVSSISLPIPLFGDMMLDSYFIRGIDDEFFSDGNFSHQGEGQQSIPVILSPLALDFLNSFADSIPGFPGLKKENLAGKNFDVEFGKSVFLPIMNKDKSQKSQLFVSGFSPLAPLLGIMIPKSEAEKLATFFGEKSDTYSRVHLLVPDISRSLQIKEEIEQMGFFVSSAQQGAEKMSQALFILQAVFLLSSFLILLLSILFLFSLLTLSVLEHQKTIGILRSLGASKAVVRNIFLFQGGIITVIGTISGMILGGGAIYVGEIFLRKTLPEISILPDSIFHTSPSFILLLLCGIMCISFISIFIPAEQAAKKDPLQLLT